ncbi:MAG: hypothetical protein ACK5KR_08000 [Breznakia sp.]
MSEEQQITFQLLILVQEATNGILYLPGNVVDVLTQYFIGTTITDKTDALEKLAEFGALTPKES